MAGLCSLQAIPLSTQRTSSLLMAKPNAGCEVCAHNFQQFFGYSFQVCELPVGLTIHKCSSTGQIMAPQGCFTLGKWHSLNPPHTTTPNMELHIWFLPQTFNFSEISLIQQLPTTFPQGQKAFPFQYIRVPNHKAGLGEFSLGLGTSHKI